MHMVRACLCAVLLSAVVSSPVRAGDMAARDIIGFSKDGRYFAFEQYGVQDGSGFPYADVFFIDTVEDAWVPGTPFRVRIDNEETPLAEARRQVAEKARNTFIKLAITEPGTLLASNPVTELSADPHKVVVNPRVAVPPIDVPWTYRIESFELPIPDCPEGMTDKPWQGFALIFQKEGADPVELHRDSSVPKSRGCAMRYAISDVVRHETSDNDAVVVALISVFKLGFEGPDRRFVAVPHATNY